MEIDPRIEHVHNKFCNIYSAVCSGSINIFWCLLNRRRSNKPRRPNRCCDLRRKNNGSSSQLANTLSRVNNALTAYRNLAKLIGKNYSNLSNLSPISRPSFTGEIEFKNVSFQFDGSKQPVISNLTFKNPADKGGYRG